MLKSVNLQSVIHLDKYFFQSLQEFFKDEY